MLLTSLALFFSHSSNAALCEEKNIDAHARINGWSNTEKNHRFVDAKDTLITAANVNNLRVKWVFGIPDTDAPRTLPLVTRDTVVIGDGAGTVYALSRDSGCEKWRYDAGEVPRTGFRVTPTPNGPQLYFGTISAEVVVLDLHTGTELKRIKADEHPNAMISGTAAEFEGIIYQPISSWEIFWAVNPFYACCTFRSSVLAIAIEDWEPRWRAFTIEQEPKVFKSRSLLPDHLGPSGAPVWSAPTVDAKRKRLYVGTGENYSSPATDTSDAIIAYDLETGAMVWKQQFLAQDAWNVACVIPGHSNCPSEKGDDLDFGAPPVLVNVDDKDYVLAGQKSGWVFALDPDAGGEQVWSYRAGAGGKAGGVHFGLAADEARGALYVPISDRDVAVLGSSHSGKPKPSLQALDIVTGKPRWVTPAPGDCMEEGKPVKNCHVGFSAAITATSDLVFAPTLDGYLRAFSAETGREVWQYNSVRDYESVNETDARGGAIDMGGLFLDGRQLFVSSGYGQVSQIAGNAFMVFELVDDTALAQVTVEVNNNEK
jgi:polyvinyl alcohol dehydrogenase (cytochrome)